MQDEAALGRSAQSLEQAPQWVALLAVVVQLPRQTTAGAEQATGVHNPVSQASVFAHGLPHAPQWFRLVCRS